MSHHEFTWKFFLGLFVGGIAGGIVGNVLVRYIFEWWDGRKR